MPAIGVIVPVYQVEAWLPGCIGSILAQSFADFTLVLVDDGSPDGCGALCDEAARRDGRVRVVHKPNGGLSSARNAGLEALRQGAGFCCEYLAFVDSDDLVHPDFLKRLYEAAVRENADLALCGVEDVLEDGRSQDPPQFSRPVREGCFAGRALLAEFYGPAATCYTVAWNKLYKASLWQALRYPEGRIHEDDAVAHLLYWQAQRVACLAAPLYQYRLRQGSICREALSAGRFDGVAAHAARCRFFARQKAPRALQQKALAAVFLRYLALCGEAAAAEHAAPLPGPFLARWAAEQRSLRGLLPALPGCPGLTPAQKLSAARWCSLPPAALLGRRGGGRKKPPVPKRPKPPKAPKTGPKKRG